MSSSLRRGTLAATVLALSASTLTACAAGLSPQTQQMSPDSAATTVGDIKIQGVNVITSKGGTGTATVTAHIFNEGNKAQTLEAIRLKGVEGKVKLSPAEGEQLTVPADGYLALGGEGNASAVIEDPRMEKVDPGESQRLTFVLSSTGAVRMQAIVVPEDMDNFDEWGPSATPAGEPTGSPSPRPSVGESATGTPTEGAATEGAEETGTPTGAETPGIPTNPARQEEEGTPASS